MAEAVAKGQALCLSAFACSSRWTTSLCPHLSGTEHENRSKQKLEFASASCREASGTSRPGSGLLHAKFSDATPPHTPPPPPPSPPPDPPPPPALPFPLFLRNPLSSFPVLAPARLPRRRAQAFTIMTPLATQTRGQNLQLKLFPSCLEARYSGDSPASASASCCI